MSPPADLDRLSQAALKSLVLQLLEEVAELRRTVAAQRDEIARLKGGPGRPNIKPSGMDTATDPKPPPAAEREPRPKGDKTAKLSIHEVRTIKLASPPDGSRFKGYTSFIVQDLVIRPLVVEFRCERWQLPDGKMLTAPLRARAPPARASHDAAALDAVAGDRHRHLQAASGASADRQPGQLSRRGPRCAARRAHQCRLDHGGRHRRAPQGRERLLHPDRQCAFHLVRHTK